MFKNYLKTGIRTLLKYKTFSFINIFGLAIAMSVCMLVVLMLADEKAYDQFHAKKQRIYRILSERPYSSRPFASTPPTLAETFRNDYAVVERATSLVIGVGGDAVSDHSTAEMRGFFADENFLHVFDYELEYGNKDRALQTPNSIILTHDLSEKLFRDENPVGQTIEFFDRGLHYLRSGKDSPPVSWGRFTITGVIAEKKYKSHLRFDALVSLSSQEHLTGMPYADNPDSWDKSFTYVLLREGKSSSELDAALKDAFARRYAKIEAFKGYHLTAQPLMQINPGIMVNQPPSFQLPIDYFYFLGIIAVAILLSACLNYTNLSTARALTRAKEIGVRKVTGARRKDLILQFISESVVTSFLALFLAMLFLIVIKPAFTGLWLNRYLNFDLEPNMSVYLIFAAFALLLGIFAGLYPALYLSAFQPVKAMKNSDNARAGGMGLRKILSVSQFVISLFFVITAIVIYAQFRYFMNFEYGFNPKDIVNVELQGNSFYKLSQLFNSIPGVSSISASEYVPATGRTSGMDLFKPGTEEKINFRLLSINATFAENMDLEFVAGRNLPVVTDSSSRYIVINETAVKVLGFSSPESIIGQVLIQPWKNESLEVVGVVKDFWLKLPIGGDPIEPAFMRYNERDFSFANVKILSPDIRGTIKLLEDKWKVLDPVHPFKYKFYEDELASTHAGIFDVVAIIGFLAFIAITIACLGMLGMATYSAERRRKEVGIRKVLGAKGLSIAFLLSLDFLKILAIAIAIGAPLAWFINNLWLQNFANHAGFGFGTVVLGTLILLTLGLITVGSQTIKVSKTNPVETLKSE